ncbi:M23 family metallopeptidase [Zobellia galactanivorans]|uniref:M23 family metallopeptidase n=1 Tax=Zobellia TaxID=112040 RepID=UPI0026E28000|nr:MULTISPECIES: M23 family metallopeptidase [Zobellia]MDO6518567.1 M23 family metallopeptidase [Zobellia uliginosa]MDO6810639.1 M23 family metallopeptidase [Zobellia galactanivorans]
MRKRKKILLGLITVLIIGFLIPQNLEMPVKGATKSDYNSKSFWFYPWGKSVTHKGVDIFAKKGTDINSSTSGLVLYTGEINVGGKVVVVLGPKWRIHYYAHLNKLNTSLFSFVSKKSKIATVGKSGNAAGKSPHLHYSILTIFPYVWRIDSDRQGWKKMFYLNPIEYLKR